MEDSYSGPITRRVSARVAARQSNERETPKSLPPTPSRRTRGSVTPNRTTATPKTPVSRSRKKVSVEPEKQSPTRSVGALSTVEVGEEQVTPRSTRSNTSSKSSVTGVSPSPVRRSSRLSKLNVIHEIPETRRLSFENNDDNESDSDIQFIKEVPAEKKTKAATEAKTDSSKDKDQGNLKSMDFCADSEEKSSEKSEQSAAETSIVETRPSTIQSLDSKIDTPSTKEKPLVLDAELPTNDLLRVTSINNEIAKKVETLIAEIETQQTCSDKPIFENVEVTTNEITLAEETPTPRITRSAKNSTSIKQSPVITRLKKTFWQQSPLNDSKGSSEPMEVDSSSAFNTPKSKTGFSEQLNFELNMDSSLKNIYSDQSENSDEDKEVQTEKSPNTLLSPNTSPKKEAMPVEIVTLESTSDDDSAGLKQVSEKNVALVNNTTEKLSPEKPASLVETPVLKLTPQKLVSAESTPTVIEPSSKKVTKKLSSSLEVLLDCSDAEEATTPLKGSAVEESSKKVSVDSCSEDDNVPIANSGTSTELLTVPVDVTAESDETEDENAVMADSDEDSIDAVKEKEKELDSDEDDVEEEDNVLSDMKETSTKTDLQHLVFLNQASSEEELEVVEKQLLSPAKRLARKRSSVSATTVDKPFAFIEMPSVEEFFENRGTWSADLLANLQQSYKDINSLNIFNYDLPAELLVKNDDLEFTWQQIAKQNSVFFKSAKRISRLLDQEIKLPEDEEEKNSDNEFVEEDSEELLTEDEDVVNTTDKNASTKKSVDLFSLKESDLANLDAKLKALDDDDNSDGSDDENVTLLKQEKVTKVSKKSVVDDDFFNLDEMETFVDEQERLNEPSVTDDDDNEDFETDYRYENFFEDKTEKKKSTSKKVRFADNDESEPMEVDDAPILLGDEKEKPKVATTHQRSRERVMAQIDQLQEENLNPRTWELSGEVHAVDRETNSLLEKYIEADFRQKQPPINGQEKSDKIYDLCLGRLKNKHFDDVERKYRDDDALTPYRNMTVDMNERKSLTAVYENKYRQEVNGETGDGEDIDPEIKEIHVEMLKLFDNLDALCHLQFAPSKVSEEIKIVKNASAMRSEEVGPLAAVGANEALLAPEEVSRHIKAAPIAKEERTKTDKLRERRKKKRKQHDMAAAGKMPKVGKAKADDAAIAKSLAAPKQNKAGADFFKELQNTAIREIKKKQEAPATVGTKKKVSKTTNRSETAAKYKA